MKKERGSGFILLEAILGMILIIMMMSPLLSLILQMSRFVTVTMADTLANQERFSLKSALHYEWLAARRVLSVGEVLEIETLRGEHWDYGVNEGRFFKRKQGGNRQYLTRAYEIQSVQFEEPYAGGIRILMQTPRGENLEWEMVFPNHLIQ